MAIWCTRLAMDRWRHSEACSEGEGADARPFALLGETAHGQRIEAVNAAGIAQGVRAGTRLTDARSLCPQLAVALADPAGDLAFLERLAVWARRWGPWSAIDPPDGVLVDVTAIAHLFGGERAMLEEARAIFARRGVGVRLAIAPTSGAAWALAHFGPEQAILDAAEPGAPGPGPSASSEAMVRLAPLPVDALRLEPDVLLLLRRLGLKRIGDLYRIGRDALRRRFRARHAPDADPLLRLDQLLGRVPEPLLPVVAVETPLVQRRLMEPIRHRPLLDQVVRDLAEEMGAVLERRGEGARRLELGLWRVDGEAVIRHLEMATATRDPAHICRLFAARLDDVDAGFGIELVRLRAPWRESNPLAQRGFDAAAEEDGTSLAVCIDRLSVRLGEEAVRRPATRASHLPERAQEWDMPLAADSSQENLDFGKRPLKLLDRPEEIAVLYATPDGVPHRFRWRGGLHEIARVEGPERIAPEWWRERSDARLRDYYRIEDDAGRRYWIYRHGIVGDGRGGPPRWFLQGLCA